MSLRGWPGCRPPHTSHLPVNDTSGSLPRDGLYIGMTHNTGNRGIGIKAGDQSVLIDMLGATLEPWMQWREITQNSLEAIVRTGVAGRIVIRPTDTGKVEVLDTGDGMTRDGMLKCLNTTLTSGNSKVGHGRNHGIGSKITARVQNPHGLTYLTLHDGRAHGVKFIRNAKGKYVIDTVLAEQRDMSDLGGSDGAFEIDPAEMPVEIRDAGHGTIVLLDGKTVKDQPAKALPAAVDALQARIWHRNDTLKEFSIGMLDGSTVEVFGVSDRMLDLCVDYGFVDLENAVAHWFIFPAGTEYGNTAGFVSQAEVYHPIDGQTARTHMAKAGIHEGSHRVALFFEPNPELFTPNAERNHLVPHVGSKSMTTWGNKWAAEFRDNLPVEIIELIAEETEKAADSRATFDRSQITRWSGFYRTGTGGRRGSTGVKPKGGKPGETPTPNPTVPDRNDKDPHPQVQWRAAAEMSDGFFAGQAGVYDSEAHTIVLDAEWAPFTALFATVAGRYEDRDDIRMKVRTIIQSQLALIAVDAFLGARIAGQATGSRKTDREFNRSISTVMGMRATTLMPYIDAQLAQEFKSRRLAVVRDAA